MLNKFYNFSRSFNFLNGRKFVILEGTNLIYNEKNNYCTCRDGFPERWGTS